MVFSLPLFFLLTYLPNHRPAAHRSVPLCRHQQTPTHFHRAQVQFELHERKQPYEVSSAFFVHPEIEAVPLKRESRVIDIFF
jgi:hypothetical protein